MKNDPTVATNTFGISLDVTKGIKGAFATAAYGGPEVGLDTAVDPAMAPKTPSL